MIRVSEAAYRRSAFVVLVSCATALAQPPEQGVSVEADSVSFGRGGSVYTGLTVTDGTVTINAAEGTTTSGNSDDGVLDFRRGLRITIDLATLSADSGTLRFADGGITQVELRGDPVTLDASTGSGARPFHLTAGRISYDGALRVLTASEGAVFASDGMEVRNCSWTYDLSDKSVQGLAETDSKGCTASIAKRASVP